MVLRIPGTLTYYDWPMLRRLLAGTLSGDFARGTVVEQFEREFAEYCGTEGAVCVSMARVALHHLLRALALPPGSEVLLHPFTMADIVNVFIAAGLRPVFVDLVPQAYTLDLTAAARRVTTRTRALLVTHLFGLAPDMDALAAFARQHELLLLEDFSQGLGCRWRDRPLGGFGQAAFTSLGTLKTCGTLFGGIILSSDAALLQRIRRLAADESPPPRGVFAAFLLTFMLYELLVDPRVYPRLLFPLTGWLHQHWPGLQYRLLSGNYAIITGEGRDPGSRHDLLPGMFFRYTDLQAREGRARLARLDALDDRRIANIARFCRGLHPEARAGLPRLAAPARHVYWRFPLRVSDRNRCAAFLLERGFDTTVNYLPLCSDLPQFRAYAADVPEAAAIRDRTIMLPLHHSLTPVAVDALAAAVNDYCAGAVPSC